jgi:putative ABC transport system substrate-binding protein
MRRREIVASIGGWAAGAWPLAPRAQQPKPLIGYLSSRSADSSADIVAAFHRGLKDEGFVVGANVAIEARFAAGNFDRLPALASELVNGKVSVLVATGGTVTVVRAKPVVPADIPIVFAMGGDPVKLGVVASLSRSGGNITGVSFLINGLAAKQMQLLHEVIPKATTIGFLINPKDPNADPDVRDARAAADTLGQRLVVAGAGTDGEIDLAFERFAHENVDAVFMDTEPFLADRLAKVAGLAMQHSLPTISQLRDFAAAGGLVSYGTSITEANRQLGVYTGRVLRGVKPADLPIVQSTRFELVINMKTAKAISLEIPSLVLARADEVIE